MARRIDLLAQQPDTAALVLARVNDHAAHQAERTRALLIAPGLPETPMPLRTLLEVEQAVSHFRQHGFATTLRQMANELDDPNCGNWGFSCLFWGVATIFICLIPSGWGCLLGYLLDQWICFMWYYCEP